MEAQIGFTISKEELCKQGKLGTNAFQVLLSPPVSGMNGKPFTGAQRDHIINMKNGKNGVYGVVHGKFIYNFCRKKCDNHIKQLIDELTLANSINCDVVIHQGKNVQDEKLSRIEAITNYVNHLTYVLEHTSHLNNRILLENSSRQGTELGYDIKELSYIFKQFNEPVRNRVGICLDLCHVFVAGELDMRSGQKVDEFMCKFDDLIGLKNLKCVHFNDSCIPFDGRNDHHADICCGYISNPLLGGSIEGFMKISQIAKQHEIPMIFETPTQTDWHVKIVNGWANGSNIEHEEYLKQYPDIHKKYYDMYISAQSRAQKTKHQNKVENKVETCGCNTDQPIKLTLKPKLTLKLKPIV